MRDKKGRFIKGHKPYKAQMGKKLQPHQGFQKGNTINLGKKYSKLHRERIGQFHRGKILSKEVRDKISKTRILGEYKPGNWKNGKSIRGKGSYLLAYQPKHPLAINGRYIREQRLIMERKIGRYLKSQEVVHHINEIVDDNRSENLWLFNNQSEHRNYHINKNRTYKKWGIKKNNSIETLPKNYGNSIKKKG